MGGRGTFAIGNNVNYTYNTIGKIGDIKVLKGLAGKHNLPMESHSSKMYIRLKPDGTFHELRMYSDNHLAVLDIDYHIEPRLGTTRKPVLHYHTYEYGSQYKNGVFRHDAEILTEKLYKQFSKYFKGIKQ
ncbi:MAG: hypothetical protein K6B46_04470 [Opitutales bacterium]|nr:hypothetical protein [Opitutales bacterium]